MDPFLDWCKHWLVTWQTQVDPVSGIIAISAVIIAALSRRDSKRSVALAQELASERGKFRNVELRIPGLNEELRVDGKKVGNRAMHPQRDMSTGAVEVVAYSGQDALIVNEMIIRVCYVKGWLSPRTHEVIIQCDGRIPSELNMKGPPLPHKLSANDSVSWRLPKITIFPMMQDTFLFKDVPNVVILSPWEAIEVTAVVGSTSWKSQAASGRSYGFQWLIRRSYGRAGRRYTHNGIGNLMSSQAPLVLKHLLLLWWNQTGAGAPPIAPKSRGKGRSRARQRRA
jgi:hypothetical protein